MPHRNTRYLKPKSKKQAQPTTTRNRLVAARDSSQLAHEAAKKASEAANIRVQKARDNIMASYARMVTRMGDERVAAVELAAILARTHIDSAKDIIAIEMAAMYARARVNSAKDPVAELNKIIDRKCSYTIKAR